MKTEDMSKPMTEGKFQYYFESIKDLIRSSTAEIKTDVAELKSDVKVLKQDVGTLKVAVSEHTRLIKGLGKKIDDVRVELKDDMKQMEQRLSDKIDGNAARLDNHETRITVLERGA